VIADSFNTLTDLIGIPIAVGAVLALVLADVAAIRGRSAKLWKRCAAAVLFLASVGVIGYRFWYRV